MYNLNNYIRCMYIRTIERYLNNISWISNWIIQSELLVLNLPSFRGFRVLNLIPSLLNQTSLLLDDFSWRKLAKKRLWKKSGIVWIRILWSLESKSHVGTMAYSGVMAAVPGCSKSFSTVFTRLFRRRREDEYFNGGKGINRTAAKAFYSTGFHYASPEGIGIMNNSEVFAFPPPRQN